MLQQIHSTTLCPNDGKCYVEKCISEDEMKKNKEIRKFLYLRTYFEYNSKKYIN